MTPRYVVYSDDLETREPDEDEVIDRIIATLQAEGRIGRERWARVVRTSHARSHGLIEGELRVLPDLPQELRQGLFAEPLAHPVVARLATVPGESLDDGKASMPRGMAIKVFNVRGPRLPGRQNEGEATQDFLLDTGATFPSSDAGAFLATFSALRAAMPAPEALKQVVSAPSRAANAALNAVGLDSANLDFFGHPPLHPLAETYYSQTPLRYGDHVAKLRVAPDTAGLRELADREIEARDDGDALRSAVAAYLSDRPAEYEVAVQLCTDLDTMPIENASKEWPQDRSPYRAVARLVFPAQEVAGRIALEEALSFCPSHSLAAHRPLGSVNRARLRAYGIMAAQRRCGNGAPPAEPASLPALEAAAAAFPAKWR